MAWDEINDIFAVDGRCIDREDIVDAVDEACIDRDQRHLCRRWTLHRSRSTASLPSMDAASIAKTSWAQSMRLSSIADQPHLYRRWTLHRSQRHRRRRR